MAGEIKSEDQTDPSLWSGYRGRVPNSTRLPNAYDNSLASSNPLNVPYNGTSKPEYPTDPHLQRSWRFPDDVHQPQHAPKPSPPSLNSQSSFSSLKRPFQDVEPSAYSQPTHDLRDGGAESENSLRASINQDHRFLSFSRVPDRQTITDAHGRPQNVDISAQIHGMFFLSEMSTTSGETTIIQPELTCYRRNLFQISGSATIPQGPLFTIADREKLQLISYEVSVSAVESVDGHNVKLIVIPWKTPPPNSPEVDPSVEQEPTVIPLISPEAATHDRDANVYPIAWRRLQFRIATANNGRRKELQQHFVLRVTMTATLSNRAKIPICEVVTAPIVVRGRSPRNFQTRKEIPLLGSSSASRGHGPLTHPSIMTPASNLMADPKIPKPGPLDPSRPPYRFEGSLPQSPIGMRQGFQMWSVTQPQSHSSTTTPTSYSPGQVVVPNYPSHSAHPEADHQALNTLPMPQAAADTGNRSAYSYNIPPTSTPQPPHGLPLSYADGNPRPSKSPRHSAPTVQQTLPPANFPGYDEQYNTHYQNSAGENNHLPPQREYYAPPTTMSMPAWAPAEVNPHAAVSSQTPTQHYHFNGSFKQEDVQPSNHYAWSTA